MPCEQGLRSDDCGDLRQNLTSEPLRFGGKSTPLVVRKTEPTITELFPQNAIFLYEVLDHVLLPLVQPARDGNDEKRKWVQTRSYRVSVTCGSTSSIRFSGQYVTGEPVKSLLLSIDRRPTAIRITLRSFYESRTRENHDFENTNVCLAAFGADVTRANRVDGARRNDVNEN